MCMLAVRYSKAPVGGEPLRRYLYELPEGVEKASNIEYDQREVTVTDLRSMPQTFTLQVRSEKVAKGNQNIRPNSPHDQQSSPLASCGGMI